MHEAPAMLLAGRARVFALFPLAIAAVSGCSRTVQAVADAGITSQSPDAAADDAGDAASTAGDAAVLECNGGPPSDGGITWAPGVSASVTAPQDEGWLAVSSDPECAAISPGAVPPRLSWSGPDATPYTPSCDPAIVDGQGDLGVFALSGPVSSSTLLRADGSGAAIVNSPNELGFVVAPRVSGFVLLSYTGRPWCDFARLLRPDALPASVSLIEAVDPFRVQAIVSNPLGGYVEARRATDGQRQYLLQVRWVDETLQPTGDWHTVMTWPTGMENSWQVIVDQQGKALLLSFVYPPSFGKPPPPSTWTFSARWMDANGPLTDPFQPLAPTYTTPNGTTLFAQWGTILPLRDGGFAMFHAPAAQGSGVTIFPEGWYALYPSGQAGTGQVPAWLQSYDGSLQLLASGAYAATQKEPTPCARTVLLIASSGATCFKLSLESSNLCASRDVLWPDGTLVLQPFALCQVLWWPGLTRLAQ